MIELIGRKIVTSQFFAVPMVVERIVRLPGRGIAIRRKVVEMVPEIGFYLTDDAIYCHPIMYDALVEITKRDGRE